MASMHSYSNRERSMYENKDVIKVSAELDDEAFRVGDFIQQLGKVQDQYFEELWKAVESNNWIVGLDKEVAKDYLFDYCFNGYGKDNLGFDEMFSETLGELLPYD